MTTKKNKILLGGIAAGAAIAGAAAAAYAIWVEPFSVQIDRLNIPVPGLGEGMDGFTVAQITDIHIKPWMLGGYLDKVVEKVNSIQPDVIALTGDYVFLDSDFRLLPELVQFMNKLASREQKLAILGNHDHWTDAPTIRKAISAGGFTDMSNTTMTFCRDSADLVIAGLDDPWEKKDRLEDVLPKIPDGIPAMLMVHEPDFATRYACSEKFFLQISGHSHGGQIRLPWVGPPVVPEHARKYRVGLYQVGRMLLYVNRGIGSVPARVRINCPPEITVFQLRPA